MRISYWISDVCSSYLFRRSRCSRIKRSHARNHRLEADWADFARRPGPAGLFCQIGSSALHSGLTSSEMRQDIVNLIGIRLIALTLIDLDRSTWPVSSTEFTRRDRKSTRLNSSH